MLSYELINQALEQARITMAATRKSLISRHDGATRRSQKSRGAQKNNQGEKINESIDAAVKNVQKNTKNYRQHIFNVYLANHIKAIGRIKDK